ncbi:MAG: hypothetical protein JXR77_10950, partial [Lentisphaeria bacterium]|nr:hypothetical protein [Lentisphaeria bacterium]
FVTDKNGAASGEFSLDSSFHVFWKTGQTILSFYYPQGTYTIDPDNQTTYLDGMKWYQGNPGSSTITLYGEIEHEDQPGNDQPGETVLPAGTYPVTFRLTEESFHESGLPEGGSWAGVMSADVTFTIPSPTAVEAIGFDAERREDGILVCWRTGWEQDNLGFHVYREQAGRWTRLTERLIAGAALGAGERGGPASGLSYSWTDAGVPADSTARYWIEDVDLDGTRTLHGPVTPDGDSAPGDETALPTAARDATRLYPHLRFRRIVPPALDVLLREEQPRWRRSPFLDDLGRLPAERAKAVRERLAEGRRGSVARPASSSRRHSPALRADAAARRPALPPLFDPGADAWAIQGALAASTAIEIGVREAGWYRVAGAQLLGAGLPPDTDPRALALYAEGRAQSLLVMGGENGRLDPGDAIEFYGVGLDTPWCDTRTYWLHPGRRGRRGLRSGGTNRRDDSGPCSFPATVETRERTLYLAALCNGDAENFFGAVVSGGAPCDRVVRLLCPDAASDAEAELELILQGVTLAPHRVTVLCNDVPLGVMEFHGRDLGAAVFPLLPCALLEGDNLVTLSAGGGEDDVSVVDTIRVTYPRLYVAEQDALACTVAGGETVTISGFTRDDIRVVDVTDPEDLCLVRGTTRGEAGAFRHTVSLPRSAGVRSLLAFTSSAVKQPADIRANRPSAWRGAAGADIVIVAHAALIAALDPLVELRREQGFDVAVVDIADVYDEFSFGAATPYALRDFLATACLEWSRTPRFLLLVGDASFDPRNRLGYGAFDLVPTKLVGTDYLETACDDWFTDLDGDFVPEIPVGRLPVRTPQHAAAVVRKIVAYERDGKPRRQVVLAADQNDGEFDFEAVSRELGGILPPGIEGVEIFRGALGTTEARTRLLDAFAQGPLLVNYCGHGSTRIWRGNLLTDTATTSLTQAPDVPFVVAMTCLNGLFQDVYSNCLAEALLGNPEGGAVAVWTSSGLTEPSGQAAMNRELFGWLFGGADLTIGEAALLAKSRAQDDQIRRTWILFGDPATRLR